MGILRGVLILIGRWQGKLGAIRVLEPKLVRELKVTILHHHIEVTYSPTNGI
jgi:hypothetical protein